MKEQKGRHQSTSIRSVHKELHKE